MWRKVNNLYETIVDMRIVSNSFSGSDDLKFICPIQECAEMFHGSESNCVHKYSLDHCCSVKQICGKN